MNTHTYVAKQNMHGKDNIKFRTVITLVEGREMESGSD